MLVWFIRYKFLSLLLCLFNLSDKNAWFSGIGWQGQADTGFRMAADPKVNGVNGVNSDDEVMG